MSALWLLLLAGAGAAPGAAPDALEQVFAEWTLDGEVPIVPDLGKTAVSQVRHLAPFLDDQQLHRALGSMRDARQLAATYRFAEMDLWLEEHGHGDFESMMGHTGLCFNKTRELVAAVTLPGVRTYCETGFNAGHSAVTALTANPELRVFSFDIGEQPYSHVSAQYVQRAFPGRFELVLGDSSLSLPTFHALHPDVVCDVVLVDGTHTVEGTVADLRAFREMANRRDAVLFVDDHHLAQTLEAVQQAEREGLARWLTGTPAQVCRRIEVPVRGQGLSVVPESCSGEVTGMLEGRFEYS